MLNFALAKFDDIKSCCGVPQLITSTRADDEGEAASNACNVCLEANSSELLSDQVFLEANSYETTRSSRGWYGKSVSKKHNNAG